MHNLKPLVGTWQVRSMYNINLETLPVLQTVVDDEGRWEGWEEWREMEEDSWVEYLALRRGGWSEVRWREWLRVAQEERRQRQRWWDLVELWATERWGGIVGGETTAADLVWQVMRSEEVIRRLSWNVNMRQAGWGMVVQEWARRWWRRWYDFGDLAEVRAFDRDLMAVMGLDEEIEDVDLHI